MGGVEASVKFAQYLVGLLADPLLAKWRARKEVEANRVLAHGQAEVMEILAKGEARASVGAMLELIEGIPSIQERVESSIDQQVEAHFEKRLHNLAQIAHKAMQSLPSGEVPDVEPDMAWTSSFSSSAQNTSSEGIQEIWAKILAGEVENQGSTSIRTLGVLGDLDQAAAQRFQRLCSIAVSLSIEGTGIYDHRAVFPSGDTSMNSLEPHGISFRDLHDLNECRLAHTADYSWIDYQTCIKPLPLRFEYQREHWALVSETEWDKSRELRLYGVALTTAGRELSRFVDLEKVPEHDAALRDHFSGYGLEMERTEPLQVVGSPDLTTEEIADEIAALRVGQRSGGDECDLSR